MTSREFHIAIEPDETESPVAFIAIVEELPGIIARGDSKQQAFAEACALLDNFHRRAALGWNLCLASDDADTRASAAVDGGGFSTVEDTPYREAATA